MTPPADFQTEEPYIIVDLDEPCRLQQVGEGWFASLSEVPNAGDIHDCSADIESERDSCRSSGCAKSAGGKVLPRRPDQSHGARIHFAQAREHDRVPR